MLPVKECILLFRELCRNSEKEKLIVRVLGSLKRDCKGLNKEEAVNKESKRRREE